jgi:hypothetical protein
MFKKYTLLLFYAFGLSLVVNAQSYPYKIGKLKYRGGGDWYANPTSLHNLIKFMNQELGTNIDPQEAVVDVASPELFRYPFVHMTGHGNVVFSREDAENLRNYLTSGGFLHIDDNYGMDPFIRTEIKKVFPEAEWVELPFNHPIYQQKFKFSGGLPKIHEHNGKPAQGFGLFHNGKLVVFYTYECDLGNGWEDEEVHKDPKETRLKALQMGANMLQYVFLN